MIELLAKQISLQCWQNICLQFVTKMGLQNRHPTVSTVVPIRPLALGLLGDWNWV